MEDSEKRKMSTKEIAKEIRTKLKKEFSQDKFSVCMESYAGGSSITVSLIETNTKIIKDFDDIPEEAIRRQTEQCNYSIEQLKELQSKKYHQLNAHTLKEEYNPMYWNNGVFLTKTGFNLLKKVVKIVDYYNYDHSDSTTDYYDVNFSFDLELGKWNKPLVEKGLEGLKI